MAGPSMGLNDIQGCLRQQMDGGTCCCLHPLLPGFEEEEAKQSRRGSVQDRKVMISVSIDAFASTPFLSFQIHES